MNEEKRKAFTLAEILIALGIIGIVAAMTIPSLMQNINNKQLITATNNFNRRFGEALKIMNSQGTLAGRKTTQGFLDELSKVFKVAKICDNTKLNQCFPKNITWGEKEVDTTTLKKSFNIVNDNWETDVMGVRFANGVSALLAYNPDCQQDSGNNRLIEVGRGEDGSIGFSTNNCLAMLYDVSSNKKPNKVGTDIQQTSNVENLGGIIANINGVKITKIAKGGSFDTVNCTDTTSEDYVKYCDGVSSYTDDAVAGASKYCDGRENMATLDELVKIAQYLYDNKNITEFGSQYDSHEVGIPERFAELGFSGGFSIWSATQCTSYKNTFIAYVGIFGLNKTGMGVDHRRANYGVLCVKH